ncbi:MAG: hemolysin family protein [Lentisphaeria bacterium]
MTSLFIYLILILLLMVLNAFFNGSEIAFTSASKIYLQELADHGNRKASCFCSFLNNSERFLGTVLVGNNLTNVSLVTLAQLVLSQWVVQSAWFTTFFAENGNFSPGIELLTTCLATPIVLVFCEILPKAVFRNQANAFALQMALPMYWISRLLSPGIAAITFASRLITSRFNDAQLTRSHTHVTREDLKVITTLVAEQGLVAREAGEMLQMALEMNEKPVETIMVPLVEVRSLPNNATVAELERLTLESGFSRFPVYEKRIDEIVGVVSLRQILASPTTKNLSEEEFQKLEIVDFLDRSVLFVPESKTVSELLYELRQQNIPMAVVVDEYGGMIGVVTIGDLAEQIVGSIRGEREQEFVLVKPITPTMFECDGRLDIRELEGYLGFHIENVGFETTAGLVLKLTGHIPTLGEVISYRGYLITVLEVKHHRISRLHFQSHRHRESGT